MYRSVETPQCIFCAIIVCNNCSTATADCQKNAPHKQQQVFHEMIEKSNMKKEVRLSNERVPKIKHMLENSQESKMVATISDKLAKEISNQSSQIELISQRLLWSFRGVGERLIHNSFNIPFTEKTFVKSANHLVKLVTEMRLLVNASRTSLQAEMQGDEAAADCRIWRNASKEYKKEAALLDSEMRELILLAKVSKRMLKEVIKVCDRGDRQTYYSYSDNKMKHLLESAAVDKDKEKSYEKEALAKNTKKPNKSWKKMKFSVKISSALGGVKSHGGESPGPSKPGPVPASSKPGPGPGLAKLMNKNAIWGSVFGQIAEASVYGNGLIPSKLDPGLAKPTKKNAMWGGVFGDISRAKEEELA